MANVVIFFPRLDIPFKNLGQVSKTRGVVAPIRRHWQKLTDMLVRYHELSGDIVTLIERPQWQHTEEYVKSIVPDYDLAYVYHRQKIDFDCGDNVRYIMQTVFPEYFTIDHVGWGANLSYCPLEIETVCSTSASVFYEQLRRRIENNVSKFDQPPLQMIGDKYDVLFVCQIPHDETIRYHSDVSVAAALARTLETAKRHNWKVLVKGHPVNQMSMETLRNIAAQYGATYICSEISIHDAIRASDRVAMVNSGVGFEAMLHHKPIFTYGRSEYQNVVNYNVDIDIANPINDLSNYQKFLYAFFYKYSFNSNDPILFNRSMERLA